MSGIDDRTAEIDAWLDGELSEAAAEELERWLCADAGRMERFVELSFLHQALREAVLTQKMETVADDHWSEKVASGQWPVASEPAPEFQNPEIPKSPISNPQSLIPNPLPAIILDNSSSIAPLPSPLYITHPFLFSNLFSLLVLCVGILGAWFYQIDVPRQIAKKDLPAKSVHKTPLAGHLEIVGRISGMADVEWADKQTATLHGANVSLGRRYALASGLLEISYNTGAKVILQGPCTYKVDARDGGFLSVGKLTARLEKKRAEKVASGQWSVASETNLPSPASGRGVGGEGGQKSEKVVSGQWSVASKESSGFMVQDTEVTNHKSEIINHKSPAPALTLALSQRVRGPSTNPQSLIPNPLFAVRTPSAVVTDLGTEFGVEVDRNGRTFTSVFTGEVMAAAKDSKDGFSRSIHLVAGQSAAIDFEQLGDATPTSQEVAKRFVRVMPAPPIPVRLLARDEANRPAYLSGWHNGDWSGDGWDSGWQLTESKTCFCFIESAFKNDPDTASKGKALIDIEQKSFGLRSKGDIASAVRAFAFQDLPINATFAIDLDTGHPGPGSMGFGLLNAADEWRFEFALEYDGKTYTVHDGLATSKMSSGLAGLDTGVPYTDQGLRVCVTRLDADAYRLKIVRLSDKREYVFDRQFVDRPSGKEIQKMRVWNYSLKDTPERSLYFNRISVTIPREGEK